MIALAAFVLCAGVLRPAQPPPADPTTEQITGTGAISGRVLAGASDRGVPFATVHVTTARYSRFQREVVADTDGRFTIDQLPSGIYRISANPPTDDDDVVPLENPRLVEVIETRPAAAIDVRLTLAAALSGRVTDERDEPVPGVAIYAMRRWPDSYPPMQRAYHAGPIQVLTDADGRFRLTGLPPVEIILAAEGIAIADRRLPDPRPRFVTTYYPGVTDQDAAKRIPLSQGASIDGLDIRMTRRPGVRVSGLVIDPRGQPYAGAKVHLQAVRRTFGGPVEIDAAPDGRFEVRDVLPGSYRFRVGPPLWAPVERAAAPEYALVSFEVGHHDVEGLVIAVKAPVDLTVRVSFEPAPPAQFPERVTLNAMSPSELTGATPAATVDEASTAVLKRLAGPLVIRSGWGTGTRDGWSLKGVFLGDRDITDIPTEFTTADSGRVRVVFTSRGAIVSGTVTGVDGRLAGSTSVLLFPENRAEWFETSTGIRDSGVDRTGAYRITGVRAGRYRVAAIPRREVNRLHGDFRGLLEELYDRAVPISVIEDELVRVDLKPAGGAVIY